MPLLQLQDPAIILSVETKQVLFMLGPAFVRENVWISKWARTKVSGAVLEPIATIPAEAGVSVPIFTPAAPVAAVCKLSELFGVIETLPVGAG